MKGTTRSHADKAIGKHEAEKVNGGHQSWAGTARLLEEMPAAPPFRLTRRERQVLSLLCEGLPNKLIARRLKISVGTVKVHVANIFRALRVTNRLQAVLRARCWELTHEPINHNGHAAGIPRTRHR
jgi:DNA-binding NarL/FixJ family response regulator